MIGRYIALELLTNEMSHQILESTIRSCSFFSRVEKSSLAHLVEMAQLKTFTKGEVIFRQGDAAPGIYIVERGLVRVFKTGSSGKEHVLHLVSPGLTFAEVAVIGNFPCPAFAEAVEDTQCVLLPVEPFQKAIRQDQQLCIQLLEGMSYWVRSLVGLLDGIVLKDAVGRVATYLLEESEKQGRGRVELPSLKRYIASHLNLTSETLSRTLRQLKESGCIEEVEENVIRISKPEQLHLASEGLFPQL